MSAAPSFDLSTFSQLVGETFQIRHESESRSIQLIEATARGSSNDEAPARVSSFALLFQDPAATLEDYLPQATYSITHSQLGSLELFIVPVGPAESGQGICYEAIFNAVL